MSSIIHKEKIMFCHHGKMCPKSRLAFFHRHVWKGTALHCVLSGVPALQRLLEHCWCSPSIHNARDNFSKAVFLVLCSLTYNLHAHRGVAVIARLESPTLAESKLREDPQLTADSHTASRRAVNNPDSKSKQSSHKKKGSPSACKRPLQKGAVWRKNQEDDLSKDKVGLRATLGWGCGENDGGQQLNLHGKDWGHGNLNIHCTDIIQSHTEHSGSRDTGYEVQFL